MNEKVAYKIDIKELIKILKAEKEKNQDFNPNIFSGSTSNEAHDSFITKFELDKGPNDQDIEQFKKDWNRDIRIFIKFKGQEYNLSNMDTGEIGREANPTKILRDQIITNLYPEEKEENKDVLLPTYEQVGRIVQHFHQKSITSAGLVPNNMEETLSQSASATKVLSLEIDNQHNMHMNYYGAYSTYKTDSQGNMVPAPLSSSNFESVVSPEGKFLECNLVNQYQDPKDCLIPKLMQLGVADGCFEIVHRDISNDRPNMIAKLLSSSKLNNEDRETILVGDFPLQSELVNSNSASKILEQTLFNADFPKDKKTSILDIVLEQENGKELVGGALSNSMFKYLSQQNMHTKHGIDVDYSEIAKDLESKLQKDLDFIEDTSKKSNISKSVFLDLFKETILNRSLSEKRRVFIQNTILKTEHSKELVEEILKDKSLGVKMLEQTVFNANFSKNNRDLIFSIASEQEHGKEMVENALSNSMVKYLDEEFKSKKGRRLDETNKENIKKGLESMISPLKQSSGSKEISDLVNDLNLYKIVNQTSREHNDLEHGFIGKIKKFCTHIVDSCFRKINRALGRNEEKIQDQAILKAFRKNVSDVTSPSDKWTKKNSKENGIGSR